MQSVINIIKPINYLKTWNDLCTLCNENISTDQRFALQSSNDSGKGKSVTESLTPTASTSPNVLTYHCNFPTPACGRLIGRYGKNINFIKERSGANISLNSNPFTPDFQLCVIEGKEKMSTL